MSGIEALGLIAQLPLLFVFDDKPLTVLKNFYRDVKPYRERYGFVTSLALTTLFAPDAPRVVHRIESRVLQGAPPDEVQAFMTLWASGFNMIGVAGAIITQIAVSGISFDANENLHWTVNACYTVGVVCGAFSVVFACLVHPALMGLDNPQRIKEWLSQPVKGNSPHDSEQPHVSAYAVMMLLAPSRLLSISVSALLIGLGIYMGLLYTTELSTPLGHLGALATLVTYLGVTIFALSIFFLPQGMKGIESRRQRTTKPASQQRDTSQWSAHSMQKSQRSQYHHGLPEYGVQSATTITHSPRPDPAKGVHEVYSLDQLEPTSSKTDSVTLELAEEGRTNRMPGQDSSTTVAKQQQNELERILQDLITAQEQYTRATQRLLEYHRSKPWMDSDS